MLVTQIQQSKVSSNGFYSKKQVGIKNNQPQIAFGKKTTSGQTQPPSANELRATQLNLKEQISVMLQTETDSKKIKKLKNYQGVLDVLLENGRNSVVNTIKTPAVAFGNAAQKAEAKKIVHFFSASSAGIAALMAQEPGLDEIALATNDVSMAMAICGVYNLPLKATVAKMIIAPIAGNALGVKAFSKLVTWIPGAGNGLNAAVAGSVTEFIGHNIIKMCESGEVQKAINKIIEKQG